MESSPATTTTLLRQRYQIVREIGCGGFGRTFLAVDTCVTPGRQCAVKQLQPSLAEPQQFQEVCDRFEREATVLAQLSNECRQIPHFYDRFTEDGNFYLVQEWIEGLTLNRMVSQHGPLSPQAVAQILCDLLPILAFLHRNHTIHRDIKPDNIILRSSDGMPVLIDFGAVKEVMGLSPDDDRSVGKTRVIGTPEYMAPEQAVGRPVYSSDLHSLALTAVYLLTGLSPQELPDDPHSGEILWRQRLPHLRGSLAVAIDRGIRFHPRARFASATEMLAVLNNRSWLPALILPPPLPVIARDLSPSPVAAVISRALSRSGRGHPLLLLAIASLAVAAAGIGAASIGFKPQDIPALVATPDLPPLEPAAPISSLPVVPPPKPFPVADPGDAVPGAIELPILQPEDLELGALDPEILPPDALAPDALTRTVAPGYPRGEAPIEIPPPPPFTGMGPQDISLAPGAFGSDVRAYLGTPTSERDTGGNEGLFANTRELRYDDAIVGQGDWVFYADKLTQELLHSQAYVSVSIGHEMARSLLEQMVGEPVSAETHAALRQVQSGATDVRSFQTPTLAGTILRNGNQLVLNVSRKHTASIGK